MHSPISALQAINLICAFMALCFFCFHLFLGNSPAWLFFWGMSLAFNGYLFYGNSKKVKSTKEST